ncbi:MAG: Gfo/Idh/MocA family protein [Acidimicrobiia bacterium]
MTLRIGLIGAGGIAGAYPDIFTGIEDASVVGVADTDAARAAALAERFGCIAFPSHGAMAANTDLDGVIVCTPPATHAAIARGFLADGVGVLCEKPLTINTATARELLETAAARAAVLTMASKFRYVADVIEAKARIERGDVGEVVLVENAFTSRVDMHQRWNSDPDVAGGGVLIDNGTHSVDLVRYLLGPIAEVMAVDIKRVQHLAVEDTARMVLRSESGVMAAVDLSWSIDKSSEDFLTVYGSEGELRIGWRRSEARRLGGAWERFGDGYDKITAMRGAVRDFLDALQQQGVRQTTPLDALASVAVIEAAYASMAACAWRPVSAETVGTAGERVAG